MKLSELKKIAEARTKGEWSTSLHPEVDLKHHTEEGIPREIIGLDRIYSEWYDLDLYPKVDAKFISTFANHADALLKVVEAAKKFINAYFAAYGYGSIENFNVDNHEWGEDSSVIQFIKLYRELENIK